MYIIPSIKSLLVAKGVDVGAIAKSVDKLESDGQLTRQGESYKVSGTKTVKFTAGRSESRVLEITGLSDRSMCVALFADWHSMQRKAQDKHGETEFNELPRNLRCLANMFPYSAPKVEAPAETVNA